MITDRLPAVPYAFSDRAYTVAEEEDAAYFAERYKIESPEWYRAEGGVICQTCGRPYREHRVYWPFFSLVKLCDGTGAHL